MEMWWMQFSFKVVFSFSSVNSIFFFFFSGGRVGYTLELNLSFFDSYVSNPKGRFLEQNEKYRVSLLVYHQPGAESLFEAWHLNTSDHRYCHWKLLQQHKKQRTLQQCLTLIHKREVRINTALSSISLPHEEKKKQRSKESHICKYGLSSAGYIQIQSERESVKNSFRCDILLNPVGPELMGIVSVQALGKDQPGMRDR